MHILNKSSVDNKIASVDNIKTYLGFLLMTMIHFVDADIEYIPWFDANSEKMQ